VRDDLDMKVRFAVAPGLDVLDRAAFAELVDQLEALGFDTIWLSDLPLGALTDPLVGLPFAAGRTERLKLGANVVPIGRNPMLLAKALAQLDQLSEGRVLLSLVPGLDQPGEREALGLGSGDRGAYLDEVIPLLRRWWGGETVDHHSDRFHFTGIAVRPLPVQQPLEIWLGGTGPKALARVGRLADGWLGAAITPGEAADARARIDAAAAEAGRVVDPEHHGLSIPYAHTEPAGAATGFAALRARRPDADLDDLLPVGAPALRRLVSRLVDEGLSKFVVRPVEPVTSWRDELAWLADAVLDLQS
jgi:probable F420-dependent oxidoreductase